MNLVGYALGPYHITGLLGQGGMATVYRARHRTGGWEVALKVLEPSLLGSPEAVARFQREMYVLSILTQLKHPSIVKMYDANWHEGYLYIAMELLDGEPMERLVDRLFGQRKHLPVTLVVSTGLQVASALAYAHYYRLIHRDIKPGNLMLLRDGRTVKVLDFGVAAILSGSGVATTRLGTPEYTPYEQIQGAADERSDVYGLGATLYHLATGRTPPPFGIDPPTPPSQLNPEVSPALEQLILRAIQREPAERFQSAAEMEAELRRLAPGPLMLSGMGIPSSLRPAWPAIAVLGVLLLVGLFAIAVMNGQPPASPPSQTRVIQPTLTRPGAVQQAPTIDRPTATAPVLSGRWQAVNPPDGALYDTPEQVPSNVTWSGPPLAEGQRYEVWLDGRSLGAETDAEYLLTSFPSGYGEHRWQVRVVDARGEPVGQSSPEWRFVILEPSTTPRLLTPSLQATWVLRSTPTRTPNLTIPCVDGKVENNMCLCPPDKPNYLHGQCWPTGDGSGSGSRTQPTEAPR